MLTFRLPNGVFIVRAAAVILNPATGQVLLHRATTQDFWSLPGGRVELHEPGAACVVRELAEELGITATAERLLWLAETFYTPGDQPHHELGFYYLVSLPDDCPLLAPGNPGPYYAHENAYDLEYRWFPVAALRRVNLYPAFLRDGLQQLPSTTCHLVTYDSEVLPANE